MSSLKIALVGIGKIARDQHVPAIADTRGIELRAACSRHANLEGVSNFSDFREMLEALPELDAVSLCTPPSARLDYAMAALEAGKHVVLEKPPAAALSEIDPVIRLARERGRVLYTTWHSRFGNGVEPARRWLADARIERVAIDWHEDVRRWHPGQDWIWEPGGLGVFDPGINALSILTAIMPRAVYLTSAELAFPANRATPIAARLSLRDVAGVPIEAEMDWGPTDRDRWDIVVETDKGTLKLAGGGRLLSIDGEVIGNDEDHEYRRIYERFVSLVERNESDIDLSPLVLVADAFMLGRRETVDAFD